MVVRIHVRSRQEYCTSLSTGPIADFRDVALDIATMPKAKSVPLLKMYCSHLRDGNVPGRLHSGRSRIEYHETTSEQEFEVDPVSERAFWALTAIRFLTSQPDWCHQYTSTIINAWPGTFKWMQYFHSHVVQNKEVTRDMREEAAWTLCKIIQCRELDARMRTVIFNTTGIVKLATALWLTADEVAGLKLNTFASHALQLSLESVANTRSLLEILEAANGDAKRVADTFVSRLSSCRRGSRTRDDFVQVTSYLQLLYVMHTRVVAFTKRPPDGAILLGSALIEGNTISVVTKALIWLSIPPAEEDISPLQLLSLKWGFEFIHYMFNEDSAAIIESLQNGFLVAFMNSSPVFPQLHATSLEKIREIIDIILPSYLVHRSVVRAVRPWIAKLQGLEVEAKINTSILRKSWYAFRVFALQRLYIRASEKLEEKRVCENVLVSSPSSLSVTVDSTGFFSSVLDL